MSRWPQILLSLGIWLELCRKQVHKVVINAHLLQMLQCMQLGQGFQASVARQIQHLKSREG